MFKVPPVAVGAGNSNKQTHQPKKVTGVRSFDVQS
jgi:hypothetical protein